MLDYTRLSIAANCHASLSLVKTPFVDFLTQFKIEANPALIDADLAHDHDSADPNHHVGAIAYAVMLFVDRKRVNKAIDSVEYLLEDAEVDTGKSIVSLLDVLESPDPIQFRPQDVIMQSHDQRLAPYLIELIDTYADDNCRESRAVRQVRNLFNETFVTADD